MSNKNTITTLFLLVVGLIAASFLTVKITKENVTPKAVSEISESTVSADISSEEIQENTEDSIEPEIKIEVPETPENAISYDTLSGTVSFTLNKNYLKSTDVEIEGTSDTIEGSAWIDPETNSYYVYTKTNISNFKTGDEKEDTKLIELLKNTNITAELFAENDEQVVLDEEFEIKTPVLITINGVTRNELFDITALVSGQQTSIEGSAKIYASDFEIEMPFEEENYKTEDLVTITFALQFTNESPPTSEE